MLKVFFLSLLILNDTTPDQNEFLKVIFKLKGENSFSSDHLRDITVCQQLYKEMDSFSKHLKGYIQNINYIPFGFLMQCETQVLSL